MSAPETSVLITRLSAWAAMFPDKLATVVGDEHRTYGELTEQIRRVSVHLEEMGIGRGDHVGIVLPNCLEFLITMLAAADLGATMVPMSFGLPSATIVQALAATGCSAVVAWHIVIADLAAMDGTAIPLERRISVGGRGRAWPSFPALLEPADETKRLGRHAVPDQTPYILGLTSGSTGAPKPIILSQRTKLLRSLSAMDMYGLDFGDVILAATPLYHSLAQRLALLPLFIGATGAIMPHFTAQRWVDLVDTLCVSFTIAVSSQLEQLLAIGITAGRLGSLKTVVSSSALLRIPVKERLVTEWKCDFHECYGASEVGIASNLTPQAAKRKLASVGQAAPGTDILILDDRGEALGSGITGEIAVHSVTAFSGYWNNEAATLQAFKDGFFLTGDVGYLDEEGFLYYVGRKKDIIITGGINVYPQDVEAVVREHPDVAEVAAIGVDDARFGETILVVIIPRDLQNPPSARSLQRHCRSRLADYQQPQGFEFVADFPRTELGKIRKCELAARFRDTRFAFSSLLPVPREGSIPERKA